MKKLIKIIILLLAISYLPYAVVLAQFELPTSQLPDLNLKPTLSLSVDPTTPLPDFPVVVATNLSGALGVNNSVYTWFLNGKKQSESSGLNKNTFSFTAGELGGVYTVGVSIVTPGGDNLSDSISLTASDFDLTWSANAQAPARYRGKILPTQNSTVFLSALPFVYRPGTKSLIASNGLIYNWSANDKLDISNSGVGKFNFNFRINNFAGDIASVGLEIRNEEKTVSLRKTIEIPVARPQTFIYLADRKTGLPYGAAIKNLITGINNSLEFFAESYFFNFTPDKLKWQWLVNNNEIFGETEKPWIAALNIPSNAKSISTQIQVKVKNLDNDIESARSAINLEIK